MSDTGNIVHVVQAGNSGPRFLSGGCGECGQANGEGP